MILLHNFDPHSLAEVCSNCNAPLSPGLPSCNSCGTPINQPRSGGFCSNCGNPLASKYSPCTKCGHTKTVFIPQVNQGNPNAPPAPGLGPIGYKSEGTALVLAILLGLIMLNGIGHLYAGKIGKGVAILLGSIVLGSIGLVLIAVVAIIPFLIPVGIVLLIVYFVIFIWQIIDARKLCVEYNMYLHQYGRPPW